VPAPPFFTTRAPRTYIIMRPIVNNIVETSASSSSSSSSSNVQPVLGKPDAPVLAKSVLAEKYSSKNNHRAGKFSTSSAAHIMNNSKTKSVSFAESDVLLGSGGGNRDSSSMTFGGGFFSNSRTMYAISLACAALVAMPLAYMAGFNSATSTLLYKFGVAPVPSVSVIGEYYHAALTGMFPDGIPQWPLDINLMIITRHQNKDDYRGFHAIKAVFPRAEQTWGVDPLTWPRYIDEAEHAVSDIRSINARNFADGNKLAASKDRYWDERRSPQSLVGVPWLDAIDLREEGTGALSQEKIGLSHHIGCLFAHMRAWQNMKDLGMNKAWIMESDGLMKMQEFSNIPLWAMTSVAQNLPEDADFVLLHKGMDKYCGVDGSLCAMHSTFEAKNLFDPSDREMLAFRHWPIEGSEAGLQTYIVSERFVNKMQEFLAAHGSDMIDAFLYGNLCQNEYRSPEDRNKLWAMNYMHQHAQKAPYSSGDERGLKILNCYIVTPA